MSDGAFYDEGQQDEDVTADGENDADTDAYDDTNALPHLKGHFSRCYGCLCGVTTPITAIETAEVTVDGVDTAKWRGVVQIRIL